MPILFFSILGYRFLAMMQLKEIEKADYAEEVLKKIFRMAFEKAQKGAEENGIAADQFLVGISSPLLDWDVRARFHRLDENTIESLFHRFELIDQSNQRKDDGRDSITTAPFTVDITAIQTKGRKRKHAGGCNKRRLRPIYHNINMGAIVEVNNTDNYCLFRAAELSRAKGRFDWLEFQTYRNSKNKQQNDLNEMLNNIELDENHQIYAIEDYGEQIQAYYNECWPSTYKLFAFKSSGNMKPFWQSTTTNWKIPVVVFYQEEQQHYDSVGNTGHLFGSVDEKGHLRGKYCYSVRNSICEIYEGIII